MVTAKILWNYSDGQESIVSNTACEELESFKRKEKKTHRFCLAGWFEGNYFHFKIKGLLFALEHVSCWVDLLISHECLSYSSPWNYFLRDLGMVIVSSSSKRFSLGRSLALPFCGIAAIDHLSDCTFYCSDFLFTHESMIESIGFSRLPWQVLCLFPASITYWNLRWDYGRKESYAWQ